MFASGSHGYDSIDQFHIDPRLGTDDDFDELVAALPRARLRVLLDGVFNHVGAEHPLFVDAMREGRDSAAAAMFAIDWDAPAGPKPRVFEGHDALVELDHRSPAAADYVTKVLDHWLDRGIDGWRLDAAYAVDARVLGARAAGSAGASSRRLVRRRDACTATTRTTSRARPWTR